MASLGRFSRRNVHAIVAALLAVAIFAADMFSPLQGAVAVLYTIVVLLVVAIGDRVILIAGVLSALLATIAFLKQHFGEALGNAEMRFAVSMVAIAITTMLCLRNRSADEERRKSAERYRTIFDTAGFAIWEADWSETVVLVRSVRARTGKELRAILNDHPDYLQTIAATARIRDLNDAAVKLFGGSRREEFRGKGLDAYHTPAAEAALVEILAQLTDGASLVECESQFRTRAGDIVDVILRVTAPPRRGEWAPTFVTAMDVTARNRAQARLAQAQAELAHAARVTTLGQLAASIAHEVNQPLSAIMTYAKSGKRWLARESHSHEVEDCFDHIVTNGARAADVITRVHALAKKAVPQPGPIDLAILAAEAIELVAHELERAGILVRSTVTDGLPPVIGDKVQIHQVVTNLLMNAIQAMSQPGGSGVDLAIDIAPRDGMVVLSVADRGPGITGAEPAKIFEPFFSTKSDGMGMGLSICRAIVEAHGGRISVANRPEGGAVFAFTLPALAETRASAA